MKKIKREGVEMGREIVKLPLGLYKTNCYIVKKDGKAIIIDPGYRYEKIIDALDQSIPVGILLTHGHADHIGAVDDLVRVYNIPVYMHVNDEILLRTKRRMPSVYKEGFSSPYIPIKEGELVLDIFRFNIFETPGHSAGSIMYQYEDCLFTGDTLFKGTIGKYTTFNGNKEHLKSSLQRIITWDRDLLVYPGHSEITTLGHEIDTNEILKNFIFCESSD